MSWDETTIDIGKQHIHSSLLRMHNVIPVEHFAQAEKESNTKVLEDS